MTTMTDQIRFNDIKLLYLYQVYRGEMQFSTNGLDAIISINIDTYNPLKKIGTSTGLCKKAGQKLFDDNYLEIVESGSNPGINYSISIDGIEEIEDYLDKPSSRLYELLEMFPGFGNEFEVNEKFVIESGWEPLEIEREGANFEAAVEATEDALDTIEGSNGYADSEPDERNQIVWTIRSGLEALRSGLPTKSHIQTLLLEPLSYLASKFADASIGAAAKHAIEKIVAWLS